MSEVDIDNVKELLKVAKTREHEKTGNKVKKVFHGKFVKIIVAIILVAGVAASVGFNIFQADTINRQNTTIANWQKRWNKAEDNYNKVLDAQLKSLTGPYACGNDNVNDVPIGYFQCLGALATLTAFQNAGVPGLNTFDNARVSESQASADAWISKDGTLRYGKRQILFDAVFGD